MRTVEADVVILGGGAAGLSAALAAAEAGISVVVVSKVYPMRSHTVAAEGAPQGFTVRRIRSSYMRRTPCVPGPVWRNRMPSNM